MVAKNKFRNWFKQYFKGAFMRYLITGGCGFLGSNISSKILEKDIY